jgi:hypothetical protein
MALSLSPLHGNYLSCFAKSLQPRNPSSKNVKGPFCLGPPVFRIIDILLAFSYLCTCECSTPDFITPVDQQFAIDLDNKVIFLHLRTPCHSICAHSFI